MSATLVISMVPMVVVMSVVSAIPVISVMSVMLVISVVSANCNCDVGGASDVSEVACVCGN